jgi:hypothetical protein
MRQETPTEAFDTPGIYPTQQDPRIQDPGPISAARLEIRPDDVCICNPLQHSAARLEMRLTTSAFATQLQQSAARLEMRPDDVCICNPTAYAEEAELRNVGIVA